LGARRPRITVASYGRKDGAASCSLPQVIDLVHKIVTVSSPGNARSVKSHRFFVVNRCAYHTVDFVAQKTLPVFSPSSKDPFWNERLPEAPPINKRRSLDFGRPSTSSGATSFSGQAPVRRLPQYRRHYACRCRFVT
jgi:hypothetical protein